MQLKDINLGRGLIVVGIVFLVLAAYNPFPFNPGPETSKSARFRELESNKHKENLKRLRTRTTGRSTQTREIGQQKDGIDRCLSGPQRVHYGFIEEVRTYLPKPSSFKHVRTRTVPKGRYHALIMDFTHENPHRVSQTSVGSLDEQTCDVLFMFIE